MADNLPSLDRHSRAFVDSERRDEEFRTCMDAVSSYPTLADNWDNYGGIAAQDGPVEFALVLLERLRQAPEIVAPLIRPISGGVYLEWRAGDRLLYFEVDEESVLRYLRNTFGEETVEDPSFDSARAYEAVVDFHEIEKMTPTADLLVKGQGRM